MKIIEGELIDLIDQDLFDVVIHGCNCFNTMGSGVAKTIRNRFPEVYETDCKTIAGSIQKLGTISFCTVKTKSGKEVVIVNAYTQYLYSAKDKPFSLDALERCLEQIKTLFHNKRIAYPAIGSGLGGGDWSKISQIIDYVFDTEDHTYVRYSG